MPNKALLDTAPAAQEGRATQVERAGAARRLSAFPDLTPPRRLVPERHWEHAKGESPETDFGRALGQIGLAESYMAAGRACLEDGLAALGEAHEKWGRHREYPSRVHDSDDAPESEDFIAPISALASKETLAEAIRLARRLHKKNPSLPVSESSREPPPAASAHNQRSRGAGRMAPAPIHAAFVNDERPQAAHAHERSKELRDVFGSMAAAGIMMAVSFAVLAACLFLAGDILLRGSGRSLRVLAGFGGAEAASAIMLVSVAHYARHLCGPADMRAAGQVFLARGIAYSYSLFVIVMAAEIEGGLWRGWGILRLRASDDASLVHASLAAGFGMAVVAVLAVAAPWEFWRRFAVRFDSAAMAVSPGLPGLAGMSLAAFAVAWLGFFGFLLPPAWGLFPS